MSSSDNALWHRIDDLRRSGRRLSPESFVEEVQRGNIELSPELLNQLARRDRAFGEYFVPEHLTNFVIEYLQ